LLFAFAETDAGIEDDREAIDTGTACAADGGVQVLGDCEHHIRNGAELAPGFRGAAHVVENQTGVILYDYLGEERIPGETAGIVDDLGAVFNGEFGHFRFVSVHGDRNGQFVAQALQHRNETPQFFGGGDTRGFGPRGLRPNIDDVRALLLHLDRAREGAVGVHIFSAIGKRIGRDVQHAEDHGALAQFNFAGLQFPVEKLSHRRHDRWTPMNTDEEIRLRRPNRSLTNVARLRRAGFSYRRAGICAPSSLATSAA